MQVDQVIMFIVLQDLHVMNNVRKVEKRFEKQIQLSRYFISLTMTLIKTSM
jgi:hypothetical protein